MVIATITMVNVILARTFQIRGNILHLTLRETGPMNHLEVERRDEVVFAILAATMLREPALTIFYQWYMGMPFSINKGKPGIETLLMRATDTSSPSTTRVVNGRGRLIKHQ
ncbi:hypothetical protein FRB94_014429 [Tulasnella sp. JGI-2019a]|nr:hypothetical protein FRB94_014429 [Tulasnella sp. JGI-2019a]